MLGGYFITFFTYTELIVPPDDQNEESYDKNSIKIDQNKGKGKRFLREDNLAKVSSAVDAVYHEDQDEELNRGLFTL